MECAAVAVAPSVYIYLQTSTAPPVLKLQCGLKSPFPSAPMGHVNNSGGLTSPGAAAPPRQPWEVGMNTGTEAAMYSTKEKGAEITPLQVRARAP